MNKITAAFIAFIALVVMIFVSWMWPVWRDAAHPENSIWLAQLAWVVVAVCLIVFLMAVSAGVTKRLLGFLINERNLMSLARFQMVFWTVIILSAFFVVALARVVSKKENPLEILVDQKLWTLLGISLTSLVGTSLINSTKTNKTPADQELTKTAKALEASDNLPAAAKPPASAAPVAAVAAAVPVADPAAVVAAAAAAKEVTDAAALARTASVAGVVNDNKQGTLYANPSISDASFSDMFEGDEVGNAAYIDLAKVQMFFFTIIAGLSYVSLLLSKTMVDLAIAPEKVNALPVLSAGMIVLLGISHAGNLAGKTADRTKLQS
jgi:hypothetical protein